MQSKTMSKYGVRHAETVCIEIEMTMEPRIFECTERTLTADVAKHAMESKDWSEDEAVCNFIRAEVYVASASRIRKYGIAA